MGAYGTSLKNKTFKKLSRLVDKMEKVFMEGDQRNKS